MNDVAFYSYECESCGQTTTSSPVKVGDVLDVNLECFMCSGNMRGSIEWDEQKTQEPKAKYINDKQLKIESL